MRNKMNAVVYYLFFASQKPVAEKIITDIFSKGLRKNNFTSRIVRSGA
jgi:hypothetical protein